MSNLTDRLKQMPRIVWIGGLIGLIIVACSCLCIVAQLMAPAASPRPTEQPTTIATEPSSEEIEQPTEPLPTEPPPTATAIPTQSPPTATAAPTEPPPTPTIETIEDTVIYEDYFEIVGTNTQDIGEALGEIGQLMSNADIGNTDWTIQVATQLAIIQNAHSNIDTADVPPGFDGFHSNLTDATSDCSEMTDHLADAIDNLDMDELEIANALLTSCSNKILNLTEKINEVLQE